MYQSSESSRRQSRRPSVSPRVKWFGIIFGGYCSIILIQFIWHTSMGEPWITVFSKIQRPVQSFLRPAVWIPGLRNLHSTREKWTFENGSHQENVNAVITAVNKVIAKDTSKFYWQVQTTNLKASKSVVRVFTFTRAEWLDITEITVSGRTAEAWAFSSGFLPLSIPLACIINVPLFWIPFLDMGLNKDRLDRITKEMDTAVERS